MKKDKFEGKVIKVKGKEYSIFIEYYDNQNIWSGETYLDDEKILEKSTKSKKNLIEKIKRRLNLTLELNQIIEENVLGDLINDKNIDDALTLIKKIDPLDPTSPLWENDPGYPSFMGFAIQKNLPFLINEMFKQIDIYKKSDLIDREFFGLCIFNNNDIMWKVFLKNIKNIKVTKKYTSESALDVLLSKDYYNRLKQILPKLNKEEKIIVEKAIKKEYDHEYFKNAPLNLVMKGISYQNK